MPTSAITGEGISDLLQLMVKLTQTMMSDRLMYVDSTECTVLEVGGAGVRTVSIARV